MVTLEALHAVYAQVDAGIDVTQHGVESVVDATPGANQDVNDVIDRGCESGSRLASGLDAAPVAKAPPLGLTSVLRGDRINESIASDVELAA